MIIYRIDGCNEDFRTLRNAKHHIYIAYTQEERLRELKGASILKIVNDKIMTATPILLTNDGYSFGKTYKI